MNHNSITKHASAHVHIYSLIEIERGLQLQQAATIKKAVECDI